MLALLAIAGAALSACTPQPEPTPTPTAAFASEEEAFAAAEEVYRAYNDAVNRQRAGDDTVDPLSYLTGQILDTERTTSQELKASGISIKGDTLVTRFSGTDSEISAPVAEIEAIICLDITRARAINSSGTDVTAPGRSDKYAIEATFTGDVEKLLVSKYEVEANVKC
jgi:hypothetical protein